MKMQLVSLTLENFKCHEHLQLCFGGRDAVLCGENGTGKTSVYDAFTWLLFGKDSKGDKDFGVKPVFTEGAHAGEVKDPGAITAVEAVLLVDGAEKTLRRTYYEVWSTRRGSAEKTREGHSSDYFVDGVPVKKNEFDRRVGELAPENMFKMLTSLFYFSKQMPWRERRAALFDVAAVASDKEIMDSDVRFSPLASALHGLTLDDYRKKLSAQRKGLNRTREDTPARLDECKKTVEDLNGIDFDALERQLEEAKGKRAEAQRELDQAEHDGGRTDLVNRIASARNELGRLENENAAYRLEQKNAQGDDESAGLRREVRDIQDRESRRQRDLASLRKRRDSLESEISSCRTWWDDIDRETFQGGVCPTCGQTLPQDKLEASRAAFEQDKDRRKRKAVDGATQAKKDLADVLKDLETMEQASAEDARRADSLNAMLRNLESTPKPEITDMDGYAGRKDELEARLAALQGELIGLDRETAARRKVLRDAVDGVDREMERLSGELAKKAALEYANRRMEELRAQAAAASDELNRVDGMLFLCEEFTRYKASFIEESINRRFSLVRFRLFREQVNGGLEDCCDVLVNGAAVGDNLNTGAEFLAGVDIINTLSSAYGMYVPLFVDGTESVTAPLPANTQLIRLEVSKDDKKLRCELQ